MRCVIGIAGAHSGAGKTTVACVIIRELSARYRVGAVKCTPTLLYTAVTYDRPTLMQADKDTARYLEAGASDALWVQSTPENLSETLEMALDRLDGSDVIVVEGNSAIEVLNPDIVIFIFGQPGRMKPSAAEVLARAAVVLSGEEGWSRDVPPGAVVFGRACEPSDYAAHVSALVKGVFDADDT